MVHKGVEEVEGVEGVSQAIRIFEPVVGEKGETRIEMKVVFDVGNVDAIETSTKLNS